MSGIFNSLVNLIGYIFERRGRTLRCGFLLFLAVASAVWAPAYAASSDTEFDASMKVILSNYLKIHSALAGDSTAGVADFARKIASEGSKIIFLSMTGGKAFKNKELAGKMASAANKMANDKDLKSLREHFKELSGPMSAWAASADNSEVEIVYCPMAESKWVQPKGKIQNPFYGSSMPECGEIVQGGE